MLLLYCLMAVVAMGGWLRFLGRLSWNILTWAVVVSRHSHRGA